MTYNLRFSSSKCSFFIIPSYLVPFVIRILYTGCAKIKKNNSGAKMLSVLKSFPVRVSQNKLKQDKQCSYNVALARAFATICALQKQ